jgi:hypothetical protein
MLTYNQQKEAINLAMQIECGTADFDYILDKMHNNQLYGINLLDFWMNFNRMTRNAIKELTYYKCRKHLEKCLEVQNG